jgi:hypothetical protein
MNSHHGRQGTSLAAHRARRDVIATGQVFQCVELRLCFIYALPKNLNAGLRGNSNIAFNQIYAARRFPKTSRIVNRMPIFVELGLSAFKLIAQFRRLLGIPLRVWGSKVRLRCRCRR